MKIILAFGDAYGLRDPDGYEARKALARKQFADAGLKLENREAFQLTWGHDPDGADDRFDNTLRSAKEKSKPNDLFYGDYEPSGYTHNSGYQHKVYEKTTQLIKRVRDQAEYYEINGYSIPVNPLGFYGIPASKWWNPHISRHGLYGFQMTHRTAPVDWFGPQFYQAYNIEDQPGKNNLHRILKAKSVCDVVDSRVPMYPFVQPVLRHPNHDYREMTDATALDMWVALVRSGVNTIVWWYESGRLNQIAESHGRRIERHARMLDKAYRVVYP